MLLFRNLLQSIHNIIKIGCSRILHKHSDFPLEKFLWKHHVLFIQGISMHNNLDPQRIKILSNFETNLKVVSKKLKQSSK